LNVKTFIKQVIFFSNHILFSQWVLHPYMFSIMWWFVLTSIGCKCYFQGAQHDEGVINLIIVDLSKVCLFLTCLLQAMKYLIKTQPTSLSWIACSLFAHLSCMMMVHYLFYIWIIEKFIDKLVHTLWPTISKFSKNRLYVILCWRWLNLWIQPGRLFF
jgi:hypothetical protein